MGKQLVNVLGLVVVAAILVAGTVLIGLPMITQSFATNAQAQAVDQSNMQTAAKVTALQSEKKDISALTSQVNALQEQIPSTNKQDDVFEAVASAAAATGVTVKSVKAYDTVAWQARTTVESTDASAADASGSGSGATQGSVATPAPTPAPTSTPSPSGSSTPPPAPTTSASSAQEQIPFEIIVYVPDAASAAAFIDALGKGPRLLGIVHAALDRPQETLELTVNALAFVHTSN